MNKEDIKLTEKKKRFCQEFVKDFNGTRSYIDAGYKAKNNNVAGVQANRLLREPKIKQYIDILKKEIAEEAKIDATWLLNNAVKVFKMATGQEPTIESVHCKPRWASIVEIETNRAELIIDEAEQPSSKQWQEQTLEDGTLIRCRINNFDQHIYQIWLKEEWKETQVKKTNLKEANNALQKIGQHINVRAFDRTVELKEEGLIVVGMPPQNTE